MDGKVVVVASIKGGVGKTTIALNYVKLPTIYIAIARAMKGRDVG